jgi:hypothetical protein
MNNPWSLWRLLHKGLCALPQRDVADASGCVTTKSCASFFLFALAFAYLSARPASSALSLLIFTPDLLPVSDKADCYLHLTARVCLRPTRQQRPCHLHAIDHLPLPLHYASSTRSPHHHRQMVNERPKQFGGMPRFSASARPGFARPPGSSHAAPASASRASQLGIGLGKGGKGLGLGKGKGVKRHQ